MFYALIEIPWLLSVIAGVFGLAIGSFLNAVEYRWSRKESVVANTTSKKTTLARSVCPHCSHVLSWYELIPVFSFVLQGGQCRACHKRISWQYPAVEIAGGVVAAFPFVLVQLCQSKLCVLANETDAAVIAFFGLALLFIFLYDLKHQLILDRVTLPLIVLALLASVFVFQHSWESLLLGMLLGGGVFAVQFLVSRGTWVGGGDIRLGVLMGALLGFPVTALALLIAYIIGAIVAVYLLATGKAKGDTPIAFGTFLAVATYVCLIYGEALINGYLNVLGV